MDDDRRDRDGQQRRPVHVVNELCTLRLRLGVLCIERQGALPVEIPAAGISHLTLIGASRMTVPLLLKLGDLGVPVFFCRRNGSLRSAVHFRADWSLWRSQLQAAENDAWRLAFAQGQVVAKLRNTARMVVTHDIRDGTVVATKLRELAARVPHAKSAPEVLGLEGAGAALLFQSLASTLDVQWGFKGRNRQPPRDPVNAALSFGYGILHRHVTTALFAAGLNPRVGLYHEGVGRHAALASDVVEEYRYLVGRIGACHARAARTAEGSVRERYSDWVPTHAGGAPSDTACDGASSAR